MKLLARHIAVPGSLWLNAFAAFSFAIIWTFSSTAAHAASGRVTSFAQTNTNENRVTITEGSDLRISWQTQDMNSCVSRSRPNHPDWGRGQARPVNNSSGTLIRNIQQSVTLRLRCTDNSGATRSRRIEVSVSQTPTPTPLDISLNLFNAANDGLIAALNGSDVDVTNIAVRNRTVVAQINGGRAGSVRFELRDASNNVVVNTVENIEPYALFGDSNNGSDLSAGAGIPDGFYTIQVSAFTERAAAGNLLTSVQRRFNLVSSVSPPPTSPPPTSGGDSDGDGVSGASDACPNTPAGESVGSNGCANVDFIPVEVIALNVGGSRYSAVDGTFFQPDQYFNGGRRSTSTFTSFSETDDDTLIRTMREGIRGYNIPVQNGLFSVEFLATETASHLRDIRRFDIAIEGDTVISDYNIFSASGDRFRVANSQVASFIDVTDGEINIDFIQRGADPRISALIVTRLGIPSLDDDNDGIVNADDQCFTTPSGISVDLEGCPNQSLNINNIVLVDADRGQAITNIEDGQIFDLASLPANLTMEVVAEAQVQTVDFIFDQLVFERSDGSRPFTLGGEDRASNGSISYRPWSLTIPAPLNEGQYEITAEASLFIGGADNPANGNSMGERTVRFTLVDSRPKPPQREAVAHGITNFRTFSNGTAETYAYSLESDNDEIQFFSQGVEVPNDIATDWLNWYNDCNNLYELVLDRPAFTATHPDLGRGKPLASLNPNGCGSPRSSAGCGNKTTAQGLNTARNGLGSPTSILPHWVLLYEMGRGGGSENFYRRGIWPKSGWNEGMPHTMAAICFHTIQGDAALENPGATPGSIITRQLPLWERLDFEFADYFVSGSRVPSGETQRLFPHDLISAMLARIVQETSPFVVRDVWRRLGQMPERDNAVAAMCDFVNAVNAETDNRFNSRLRGEWGMPNRCP